MNHLTDVDVQNKRVLVRVDFNVPIEDGQVKDDTRLQAVLPTLEYLQKQGAKIILCSHLGKPKGKKVKELSLAPVAKKLSKILNKNVMFCPECIGDEVKKTIDGLSAGDMLLLENLRFHPGEQANDKEFARNLGELADVYVNDAFGVAHREHASVCGVTSFVPECCAGFLLQKEIDYLSKVLKSPKRPFVAVLGGSKVSSKLGVLYAFIDKVDKIIVGGAMANTFLAAQGYCLGRSKVEQELFQEALEIIVKAKDKKVGFYLPVDFICGTGVKEKIGKGVCPFQEVPANEMALDIGPATSFLYAEVLKDAKSVVWNGPMGAFENSAFAQGSLNLAEDIARVDGLTVVGGGDTDALVHRAGLRDKYSFISTGGGSFLRFMEGHPLPALVALENCAQK
ncbi:MAG: phosphoglycerate kinase [Desulfonauticus sp.]|nr:phosphoglycerate kinase [Desulfonauticus sp.]